MTRVSVIIPTYNRADMLHQAILSVLAQVYSDFEVIIVDDGSTDNTPQVVDGFCDSRIRYIWQENQERSAARNNGVLKANGDLIAFLDSDDVWLPNHLATLVEMMDRYPEAVLGYGSDVRMDEQNRLLTPLGLLNQSDMSVVRDCHDDLVLGWRPCTIVLLLRRSAFEDVGGFDIGLSLAEDWDLWIRISELGPFCNVHLPVAAVRVHALNSMNDIVGLLTGSLAVIEKTSARRGKDFNQRSRTNAELVVYASAAAWAIDRNMPEASNWIAAALERSAILHETNAIRQAFVGYSLADVFMLHDCRNKARELEASVHLINSLGGSESRNFWLGSFWGAVIHAAHGVGDNRFAAHAFLHLLTCGGIGKVDSGVISAAVRAMLAWVRHPRAGRKPLPREREITAFLEGLREASGEKLQ